MNLGSRLALLLVTLLLGSLATSSRTVYFSIFHTLEEEHQRQNLLLAGDVKSALEQQVSPQTLLTQYGDDSSLAQFLIRLPDGTSAELPPRDGKVLEATSVRVPFSEEQGEIVISSNDILVRSEAREALVAQLVSFIPLTLIFFVGCLVALRSILRPLYQLEAVTERLLAQLRGEDSVVELKEIEFLEGKGMPTVGLAKTLLTTGSQLHQTLQDLEKVQAQGMKMEAELRLAGQIQKGLLPPESLKESEFSLEASLVPANEVGGDLYTYFWVKDALFFAVGDVTGKGVPAALFMGATQSLLRGCVKGERSLGEEIAEVNDILSTGNSEMYFVTFFCGLFQPKTGTITYVNAGHPAPLLRRQDGHLDPLALTSGTALGVSAGLDYQQEQFTLHKGETLIVFSDGLSEAGDAEGKLYEEFFPKSLPGLSAREIIQTLIEGAREFSGCHELDDDTTLLCLELRG